MAKGLSPLQKNILAVLEEFPAYEEAKVRINSHNWIEEWARPRDIMKRLCLPPTASNRAAVSKSLARLWDRGRIVGVSTCCCMQGHGWRYLRVDNPDGRAKQATAAHDHNPEDWSELADELRATADDIENEAQRFRQQTT